MKIRKAYKLINHYSGIIFSSGVTLILLFFRSVAYASPSELHCRLFEWVNIACHAAYIDQALAVVLT